MPLPRLADDDDDTVRRLNVFTEEHPEVNVLPPESPRGRWRAEIRPGTVPGDDREMIVTEWDLGKFVGKLEALFPRPG
jgi:hypothetical protein